jgi:endonuclease G
MKRARGILLVVVAGAASVVMLSWNAEAEDNSEVAPSCVNNEYLADLFTVGGRPVNKDPDHKVTILVNHGYAVGYCQDRRNPLWAIYVASRCAAGEPFRFGRPPFFSRDLRVSPAVDDRPFGPGYTRGHMAPNAAIGTQYGALAQMETFLMTNTSPQKAELDQGAWMHLEQWIPQEAEKLGQLYVICGPIFGDKPKTVQVGSKRKIQIPDAFYMILVDTQRDQQAKPTVKLLAYRFPQDTPQNADFMDRQRFGVSVDQIEAATKLDFFPLFGKLGPNWEAKEAETVMTHWEFKDSRALFGGNPGRKSGNNR